MLSSQLIKFPLLFSAQSQKKATLDDSVASNLDRMKLKRSLSKIRMDNLAEDSLLLVLTVYDFVLQVMDTHHLELHP